MSQFEGIVNMPDPPRFEENEEVEIPVRSSLASFITTRVDAWREYREQNYDMDWEQYYRLWRGKWDPQDKVRNSERSRLISPALQQAIEAQVAEFEEATFSRETWFNIVEDMSDEDNKDTTAMAKLLKEDMEKDKVQSAISEVYLNAALYGTGIGKVVVVEEEVITPEDPISGQEERIDKRLAVKLVAVDPFEFVIDPAAKSIEDAMGVAHEMLVPRHSILKKQASGMYYNVSLGTYDEQESNIFVRSGEQTDRSIDGKIKITEYYGLVPSYYLSDTDQEEEVDETAAAVIAALAPNQSSDGLTKEIDGMDLVEAWVTIANDSVVLRAIPSPFLYKDRPFVAYQHDKVPNRFYGRGVSEKGFNVQKSLDGELRARMDTLALSTYPMIAMDKNAIPRGGNFQVRPGRTFFTNGDPNAIFKEFKFSEPGPASFRETGDLERMIQMATGSMDSAAPIGTSPRNATASGMSMISTGAMKRQKRTLKSIERDFLSPLLKKIAFRYMQYDRMRYPFKDYIFSIRTGLGLVARELEQQNLVQLLQTSPPGTPSYWMILKNIWAMSSVDSKEDMIQLTDQMLQQSLQPAENPELELKKQDLELRAKDLTLKEMMFAWDRSKDMVEFKQELRRINQRSTEYAIDMQKVEAMRPQYEATALEKTAIAIERLAKASAEEGALNIKRLERMAYDLDQKLNKVSQEGEESRAQATEEFLRISNSLQEQADILSKKEDDKVSGELSPNKVKAPTPTDRMGVAPQQAAQEQAPAVAQAAIPPELMSMLEQLTNTVMSLKEEVAKNSSNKEPVRAKKGKTKIDGNPVNLNSDGSVEDV